MPDQHTASIRTEHVPTHVLHGAVTSGGAFCPTPCNYSKARATMFGQCLTSTSIPTVSSSVCSFSWPPSWSASWASWDVDIIPSLLRKLSKAGGSILFSAPKQQVGGTRSQSPRAWRHRRGRWGAWRGTPWQFQHAPTAVMMSNIHDIVVRRRQIFFSLSVAARKNWPGEQAIKTGLILLISNANNLWWWKTKLV